MALSELLKERSARQERDHEHRAADSEETTAEADSFAEIEPEAPPEDPDAGADLESRVAALEERVEEAKDDAGAARDMGIINGLFTARTAEQAVATAEAHDRDVGNFSRLFARYKELLSQLTDKPDLSREDLRELVQSTFTEDEQTALRSGLQQMSQTDLREAITHETNAS